MYMAIKMANPKFSLLAALRKDPPNFMQQFYKTKECYIAAVLYFRSLILVWLCSVDLVLHDLSLIRE